MSSTRKFCLQCPDVSKLLQNVIRTAVDGNHNNQAVAQKILMDKLLPVSAFEKLADSREKINIVIHTPRSESETAEGEVTYEFREN